MTPVRHHEAMAYVAGDPVHVALLGKGTVREVRNGGAYLVEVKGRLIVATADRLTPQDPPRKAARSKTAAVVPTTEREIGPAGAAPSLDLHGLTVDEALEAVNAFLNRSFLASSPEVRIIHGRSGGRLKAAVHAHLRGMMSIRGFALDPRNAGVTIVKL
ncbi:MAG TPA: Smr/MutS family protein [Thermoanaerobaculia bacterium]|nr:Smr/MutS family protein [Thermoanaerobaculia bacterium]